MSAAVICIGSNSKRQLSMSPSKGQATEATAAAADDEDDKDDGNDGDDEDDGDDQDVIVIDASVLR